MLVSNRLAGWLKSRPFLLLLSFLLAVILLTSWQVRFSSAADESDLPFAVVALPEEALSVSEELTRAPAMVTNEHTKLDWALAQLVNADMQPASSVPDFGLESDLRFSDGRVQVRVLSTPEQLEMAAKVVSGAGGEVTYVSELEPELQAWIPVNELESVAADTAVSFVSQPAYVVPLDADDTNATSEGFAPLGTGVWHYVGDRGGGVKIAIIDGGFLGYPGLLGSDLPAIVTVKNFVDGETDGQVDGTTKHGTACAEIVADIAPDAQFYLFKIATNLDLQQAVNYAIGQGVDVISTSVGWYNLTPGDGTGQFADLAALAKSNGIIWATASGNDREAHWGGQYYDPEPDDENNYHYYNSTQNVNYFGPGNGNAYLIPSGYLLRVYIRWDDWAAVNQDYNLLVVAWNNAIDKWEIVGTSSRPQSGLSGQRPTEDVIGYTVASSRPYGFVIEQVNSNRDVNLEIFAPKVAPLDEVVYERSLPNLADAPAAMTVGAVGAVSPYAFQDYSGQGPTNGPGGSLNGGFMKPDLTAYTGVSTESYGPGAFAGTSASAPHVAGAAALVKGSYPLFSPQQIQNFLQNWAIDMGTPGMDTSFGYGRAFLGLPSSFDNHIYLPIGLKNP